jgi:hypothetical protein
MPKAIPSCGAANYFLIATLIVFFMLLYVYASRSPALQSELPKLERFNAQSSGTLLGSPDKIVVLQGSQAPDSFPASINWDNHQSMPTVDGTDGTPRSMFMFAYNQCSPSCCNKGSPYTCSGGCVCMTDQQKNFVGTRGANSKSSTCSGQSEF